MCKSKFTDKMLISLKCTLIQECMNSDYVYFDFFGENRPDDDQEDLYAKVEETLEQMPEEELMKVLLIHTDGYSIDVVGKYNTKEEACKQLNFEYERKIEYQEMFSNGIDSEWMKSSHCDNEEAILYINGEEVHVWQIVTA